MVKQYKRRAWKKNDIADVEEALEDERLVSKLKNQSEKGKGARPEHELFKIDTAGSGEGLSVKARREMARAKIFQDSKQDSKDKAGKKGPQPGLPLKVRREIARAKLFPPKDPRLPLSMSEEAKVERAERALEQKAKARPKKPEPKAFNVWAGKTRGELLKKLRENYRWVRRTAQSVPLSKPRTMHRRVNEAPAVIPPHEGQSMNPPESSYKDVAFQAAAVQLEEERQEEELDRHFTPMTHQLRDAVGDDVDQMAEEAKIEMLRSISCTERKSKELPPIVPRSKKPKSESKRNKERKRKILDEQEKVRLKQRKLEKSVGEIGRHLKEMKQEQEEREQRKGYRKAVCAKRKELERTQGAVGKVRRIGLGRFKEQHFVAVPEEGASNLRALAVKGSAVQERIDSIISRGLLPPRVDKSYARNLGKRTKGTRTKVFSKNDVTACLRG